MHLTERLKDIQKRLGYLGEIKNLRPEDYQAVLVSIIRDCQRDGAETEREACEKILDEEYAIYLKRGFAPEECFVNAIERIRARSESPIAPPNGVNWCETLFSILNAVAAAEGVLFDSWWTDYGVSEAERDMILAEWRKRNEPPEKQ